MNKYTGLGRGLSSLIPSRTDKVSLPIPAAVAGDEMIIRAPLKKVVPNPQQPRTNFDTEGLEELVQSIREHGIVQPLIVCAHGEGYQVIAGERRLRAAQLLELETVPVIVREVQEQEKLELALIENIQRRNLNPIEEAVAYQRLINEFNLTQEQVAKRVGKSRSVITNTLRVLSLPTEIQQALVHGKISYSTARVIAGLPAEQRLSFFRKVLAQDLTVRAAEGAAKQVIVRKHTRRSKDAYLMQLEDDLQTALGTKVEIKKSGKTGKVSIDFYSDEDLSRLTERLLR